MDAVVPCIRRGGVNTVYVMPNLSPPITTVQQALSYHQRLEALEPNVTFLLSLYLHSSITPETIVEARTAGISGVKCYPAGVTTNSSQGIVDYESFYPVFAELERQDLILNLHGECPSSRDITILNAEERFLPVLRTLHRRFPKLRIVLEHCTTAAAIEAVRSCGSTVVGTITPHHLFLTVDDWANDPFNFCKPVAKLPADRTALLQAVVSGNPKFFLGSDSAPHSKVAKTGGPQGTSKTAAGVFTQPYVTPLVLDALEQGAVDGILQPEDVTVEKLRGFLSGFGRDFYRVPDPYHETIELVFRDEPIDDAIRGADDLRIVPFRRSQATWTVRWTHTQT
ncbi:MAG: hypothetical protein M1838_003800 [Thelocarpon superellum]|nr:MAG: hypothetical protein M1838_003800 [Thelocarpon superellum]